MILSKVAGRRTQHSIAKGNVALLVFALTGRLAQPHVAGRYVRLRSTAVGTASQAELFFHGSICILYRNVPVSLTSTTAAS